MNKKVSITTVDNPFNPITDFDNWYRYDIEKGYYTCNKLARLAKTTEDMTSKEEKQETEKAIDRLIEIDPLDLYIKVTIDDEP